VLNASAYSAGFNDYSNVEWIGEVHKVLTKLLLLGWPHAGTDHLTVSYLATYINVDFCRLVFCNRCKSCFSKESGSITDLADYRYWITNKFTFTFDADHAIIRTPEMILIEAEAKTD
jgi:hypothetical protein